MWSSSWFFEIKDSVELVVSVPIAIPSAIVPRAISVVGVNNALLVIMEIPSFPATCAYPMNHAIHTEVLTRPLTPMENVIARYGTTIWETIPPNIHHSGVTIKNSYF